MSSIKNAKEEAQKLIKEYNKLQAESRTADTVEESTRKAANAEKLVSQISTLQSAITKLHGEKQTTTVSESEKDIEEISDNLDERLNNLENAQQKARSQIEQLSKAKAQITRFLKDATEKSITQLSQKEIAHDKKLQKELSAQIQKKEAEHDALKQEIENIRQESQKETEIVTLQRDAARAVMEEQKQLEIAQAITSFRGGRKGLWIGISIGALLSVLVGGVFLYPLLTNIEITDIIPKNEPLPIIDTSALNEDEPAEIISRLAEKPTVTSLGEYTDKLKNGGKGPVMVHLPDGTFKMGSKNTLPYHNERPQHNVTLQNFSISKYEVTFEEYDRFAKKTRRSLPNDNGWGRKKRPVINVNWNDATAYAKWLTEQTSFQYRLPTEREWEYAAKAGTDTLFWWGFRIGTNNANCAACGSAWKGKKTAPVGSFPANDFGIYDSIGNVIEWTLNCYHTSYRDSPARGNNWEGGNCALRTVRSSSYRSAKGKVRTTIRLKFRPTLRLDTLGFRVVRVND